MFKRSLLACLLSASVFEQGLAEAAAGIEVRDVRKEIRKGAEQGPANP